MIIKSPNYSEPWKRPCFSSIMNFLEPLIKSPTPQLGHAEMSQLAWWKDLRRVFCSFGNLSMCLPWCGQYLLDQVEWSFPKLCVHSWSSIPCDLALNSKLNAEVDHLWVSSSNQLMVYEGFKLTKLISSFLNIGRCKVSCSQAKWVAKIFDS